MKRSQGARQALLLAGLAVTGLAQAQTLAVETLHNQGYRYLDGAGCYYVQPGHRVDYDNEATWQYRFLSGLDDDAPGWVQLGGQGVELKRVKDSAITPKVGERRQAVFEGEGIVATLDVKITQADTGNWDEQGTLTVARGGQRAEVPVEGNCGS